MRKIKEVIMCLKTVTFELSQKPFVYSTNGFLFV